MRKKFAIDEFMIDRLESVTSCFDRLYLVHLSLSLSTFYIHRFKGKLFTKTYTFVDVKIRRCEGKLFTKMVSYSVACHARCKLKYFRKYLSG